MKDDELPPLPLPLPPTHSRSFSSSSSSSAGSPQPPATQWGRRTTAHGGNGTAVDADISHRRELQLANDDATRGTTEPDTHYARSESSRGGSPTSTRDSSRPSHSPTLARPPPRPVRPASSSEPSTLAPSDSTLPYASAAQRTRASAFLSKVSPSLSSHSRYSNSPSNIASIGLRGSPEPLGLGIGSGSFSRSHLGGLPSPPPTNSDEGSTEGGSRYGTVRGNDLEQIAAGEGSRTERGEGGDVSPLKPDRPPKSERRSTSTPTNDGSPLPMIDQTSSTINLNYAGGHHGAPSFEQGGMSRSSSAESFRRSASPSPSSRLTPSASTKSMNQLVSDGDHSDAVEELREGLAGVEPRRRLRARTGSVEAGALLDGDENLADRGGRSHKGNERREKNQRILDSINSYPDSLASPPASNRGISPSPSSDFDLPRRAVQRSSTSSTIRKFAAGEDELLHGTMPNFSTYGSSTDDDEPQPRVVSRRPPVTDLQEFGVPADAPMRRSATVGDVSARQGSIDRDDRSQTAGFQSRPRTSLLRRALDDGDAPLPERSATSLSSYPSTIERIRARRSDLVGSDRTRAASSFSDTKQQDEAFSEGMRKLASRELLRTPRDRTKSQSDSLGSFTPASHGTGVSPPTTLRNRPALPSEFRHSPSPSLHSVAPSRVTPRRSIDTSSARLTPSSSSSRDLDRFARSRSAVASLASPISPSTSSTSIHTPHRHARSEASFDDEYSLRGGGGGDGDEERELTPKSAKKSAFGQVASVGRARTSLGYVDRRTSSVSEVVDRPLSRAGRETRRSGELEPNPAFPETGRAYERRELTLFRSATASDTRSSDGLSRGNATPPLPSSARSEERNGGSSADLAARKERLRNVQVGSEAWMAELDNLRRRGTRSRTSGSSIDGRSNAGDYSARSPSEAEREKTVRAINALLAGQGIVATAVDPASPSSPASNKGVSPRKRESLGAYDRHRKISFANGTHEDSRLPPGSNTMSRSNSATSRNGGADPVLQGLVNQSASVGDHHKLLLSAFDHFDRHFSQAGPDAPESVELVKRMVALIASTTKLNTGLRTLAETIKEEHIQAQVDEAQRDSTVSLTQFEKGVHALVRTSDDQVRNLSEDLIAITRVDRERERLRRNSQEVLVRSASRSSNLDQSISLSSPPKRSTPAGVHEGGGGGSATVSLSSSRSPNAPREVLRNPLEDPSDPASTRRGTLNFAGRSPFGTAMADSPTPASRRSGSTAAETPIRRQSISTSSTYSSGTASRPGNRRGKSSDPSRSPTQIGAGPFPTATASVPIPQVDATPALSNESPTRTAVAAAAFPFPRRPFDAGPPRTYSGASGDAIAYEALELAANVDEARTREARERALDRLETSTSTTTMTARGQSPTDSSSRASFVSSSVAPSDFGGGGSTTASASRRPRTRSSMGAIGSALKNAFTPKKKGANESPAAVSSSSGGGGSGSASMLSWTASNQRESLDARGSPEEMRRERRKEVENILRRTASRST
ncbi:hypothetical protein JCM11491_005058 [Sporobolomyces phaffii]